jgi:universal stress protein E
MQRIVTGVDFSETSPRVAAWACRFLAPDGETVLCHVVDEPGLPGFLQGLTDVLASRRDTATTAAAHDLEELGRDLPCATSARIVRGRPADQLANLAATCQADLIAIGPRGARASRIGTTAEQLVRLADRPVLVVHEPRDADPGNLLIAVDSSGHAAEVLDWGRRLMERFDCGATVLHVLDGEHLVALRASAPGSEEHDRAEQATGATRDWLAEQAEGAGLDQRRTTVEVVFGSPVHEIASRTEGHEHDLVVMGSRGVGGVRREFFGSVASGVLRAAWGPVLIV